MEKCKYCGSKEIFKFGKYKGSQQYHCKSCDKTFNKNSNVNRGSVINGEKYCNSCERFKPLSEFTLSEGKPRSRCKKCFNEKNNSRYRQYNINEDIFNEMLVNQNHKCAICGNKFKSNKKTFIDHCHESGKVRGLLCPKCNSGIGQFNDNIQILNNAIDYILTATK